VGGAGGPGGTPDPTLGIRVMRLEEDVKEHDQKMDKIVFLVFAALLSLCGALVVAALYLSAQ
jgi:hypothetical protein